MDEIMPLHLDRMPPIKLQMESNNASVEQKKNCDHYAVIGNTLLLRSCPLLSQPKILLPAGSRIVLPPIKGFSLPELRLHINYAACRALIRTQDS
jgi:hypothetical protein